MRSERYDLKDILEGILQDFAPLELFDFDAPMGRSGVLRVYIYSPTGQIELDQCAAVSRAILNLETVEDILPGQCTLEVSSPGINRRLRHRRHFEGAVGERIKITVADNGKRRTYRGKLDGYAEDRLSLSDEESGEKIEISYPMVVEARVDFAFK